MPLTRIRSIPVNIKPYFISVNSPADVGYVLAKQPFPTSTTTTWVRFNLKDFTATAPTVAQGAYTAIVPNVSVDDVYGGTQSAVSPPLEIPNSPVGFGVGLIQAGFNFGTYTFFSLPIPPAYFGKVTTIRTKSVGFSANTPICIGAEPSDPALAVQPPGFVCLIGDQNYTTTQIANEKDFKRTLIENIAPKGGGMSNFAFLGDKLYLTNALSRNIVCFDLKSLTAKVVFERSDHLEQPQGIYIDKESKVAFVPWFTGHSTVITLMDLTTEPLKQVGSVVGPDGYGATLGSGAVHEQSRTLHLHARNNVAKAAILSLNMANPQSIALTELNTLSLLDGKELDVDQNTGNVYVANEDQSAVDVYAP